MNDSEIQEEEEKKGESIKVVLIGNSGVGKTCISSRYISDKYMEPEGSTVGASYFQKYLEIDGKYLQLDIWDTAGQEKYRSMGKMFYKDAYIVLFVYDITDRNSFSDLKKVWYEELKRTGEKYTVYAVVGNKSDLYLNEQVNEDEARKWADEIDAIFGLVSAKTGDCINALFENCVKKYLSPDFEVKIISEKKEKEESKSVKIEKKNINNNNNNNNNDNNKKKKKWFFC